MTEKNSSHGRGLHKPETVAAIGAGLVGLFGAATAARMNALNRQARNIQSLEPAQRGKGADVLLDKSLDNLEDVNRVTALIMELGGANIRTLRAHYKQYQKRMGIHHDLVSSALVPLSSSGLLFQVKTEGKSSTSNIFVIDTSEFQRIESNPEDFADLQTYRAEWRQQLSGNQ